MNDNFHLIGNGPQERDTLIIRQIGVASEYAHLTRNIRDWVFFYTI